MVLGSTEQGTDCNTVKRFCAEHERGLVIRHNSVATVNATEIRGSSASPENRPLKASASFVERWTRIAATLVGVRARSVGPTVGQERYEFLDVLRGLALASIVLANMVSLSLYLYLSDLLFEPNTTQVTR